MNVWMWGHDYTLEANLKISVFRFVRNVWTSSWTRNVILHRNWWCHAFITDVNVGIYTSLLAPCYELSSSIAHWKPWLYDFTSSIFKMRVALSLNHDISERATPIYKLRLTSIHEALTWFHSYPLHIAGIQPFPHVHCISLFHHICVVRG